MQWGIPFHNICREKGYHYYRYGGKDSLDFGNMELNGQSTREMVERIKNENPDPHTALLFNCGLHDIRRSSRGEDINVPLKEYKENKENLGYIIQVAEDKWEKILWINTTPVDDERHSQYCHDCVRKNEDVIRYNKVAEEVMEKYEIPVIDLYSFTAKYRKVFETIYFDHVHMKKEISEKQAYFIMEKMERAF